MASTPFMSADPLKAVAELLYKGSIGGAPSKRLTSVTRMLAKELNRLGINPQQGAEAYFGKLGSLGSAIASKNPTQVAQVLGAPIDTLSPQLRKLFAKRGFTAVSSTTAVTSRLYGVQPLAGGGSFSGVTGQAAAGGALGSGRMIAGGAVPPAPSAGSIPLVGRTGGGLGAGGADVVSAATTTPQASKPLTPFTKLTATGHNFSREAPKASLGRGVKLASAKMRKLLRGTKGKGMLTLMKEHPGITQMGLGIMGQVILSKALDMLVTEPAQREAQGQVSAAQIAAQTAAQPSEQAMTLEALLPGLQQEAGQADTALTQAIASGNVGLTDMNWE